MNLKDFEQLGFSPMNTGGGCEALRREYKGPNTSGYILVTLDDGVSIPTNNTPQTDEIIIGLYDNDHHVTTLAEVTGKDLFLDIRYFRVHEEISIPDRIAYQHHKMGWCDIMGKHFGQIGKQARTSAFDDCPGYTRLIFQNGNIFWFADKHLTEI